jgi:hypothetical protein
VKIPMVIKVMATLVMMIVASNGCSSEAKVSTGGPLHTEDTPGQLCVPTANNGALSIGHDILKIRGSETVTVDRVELADPANLALVGARLMKINPGDILVGTGSGFPPSFP